MVFIPFGETEPGIFVERENRFVARVERAGRLERAHIATSGRLWELLTPGARLLLEKTASQGRITPLSLRAAYHNGVWVSVDAQIPNKLLAKALRERVLSPFAGAFYIKSEPAYEAGRFDFLLEEDGQPVYIEVKSVTLAENGVALFPDAPTERGRRHLEHLARLAGEGCRTAVIFVAQRQDTAAFAPNARTDPAFALALRNAVRNGVEAYAYNCLTEKRGITLGSRLPVMV